jgi:hypothetical protein
VLVDRQSGFGVVVEGIRRGGKGFTFTFTFWGGGFTSTHCG